MFLQLLISLTLFIFCLAGYVKYASLVVLTIQNAALGLSMRYALTRDGTKFSPPAGELEYLHFKP